jgi:O-antigen/teichoic acid export membrane protein
LSINLSEPVNIKLELANGIQLTKNTLWNLLGHGLPLIVGVVTIPALVDKLGTERFGVLAILWVVIGYFSLFDFGIGRALTKMIAEQLGNSKIGDIPALIQTALVLTCVLGILGTLLFAGLTRLLVEDLLNIDVALQKEVLRAFFLMAMAIPFVIVTTCLRGILEAYQRFTVVAAVRIPMGIFIFIGPLAVLQFNDGLLSVVISLFTIRVIALGTYLLFCLHLVPGMLTTLSIQRRMIRSFLTFGGWMTVCNIISPLMVYLDRFLIGAIISMTAVSYYSVPYEVVTKLWVLSIAIVGVLFPAFSATVGNDKIRAAWLFDRAVNFIFLIMFPLSLVIIALSYEGLELWLGTEFARNGQPVLQRLAVGVFIHSLARVPFVLIQSAGRPDILAKTFLIELPLYLIILWWSLVTYGIKGAATVWTIRIMVDTVIFFMVASYVLPETKPFTRRNCVNVFMAIGALIFAMTFSNLLIKLVFMHGILLLFALWSWTLLLNENERRTIKDILCLG